MCLTLRRTYQLIAAIPSALWEKVPRVALSKEAVVDVTANANVPPVLDATKPIAAIVQMKDPSKPASKLPPEIESKLESLHQQYAFQWDESRLYGYVEIAGHDWDTGHPHVSGNDFKRSPSAWLPFGDWHPNPGVAADMRFLVPLAHAQEGYVLGSVVPFVLTK